MTPKSNMIFSIFFTIAQLCTAQIHPEQRAIQIITDEHGILHFGDPVEQNETTEPQATKITITDKNIESLSAEPYQQVYTLMRKAEVYQNIANPEAHPQETMVVDMDMESINMDLGTLLACGDLGPLSLDDINIDALPFVTDMEPSLNDSYRVENALTRDAKQLASTSDRLMGLQTTSTLSEFSYENFRNLDEKRDGNMAGSKFSGSPCRQPLGNVSQSFVQSDNITHSFASNTGQKQFQCDICLKQFLTSRDYRRHRRIHTEEKPFQCDLCKKQFNDRSNCQRHRRTHTGEKPFQCDTCLKEFRAPSDYKKHLRTHTGEKPFQCDFCKKHFSDCSNYQRHRRIHTGEKPFQCDICQKEFRGPSDYKKHRRTHTGEKPFHCDICPKQFHTSSDCNRHRRTHTGERSFQCDICPKQFRTSSEYRKHQRTHTGERPFQCDICPKQFRVSSDYKKHRRTHTGEKPFQCDICKKQFHTSNDYNTHRRTHTRERPFQCDICPKQFRTSGNYHRHRRTHRKKSFSNVTYAPENSVLQ